MVDSADSAAAESRAE
jgi:soluble cytochrome b562